MELILLIPPSMKQPARRGESIGHSLTRRWSTRYNEVLGNTDVYLRNLFYGLAEINLHERFRCMFTSLVNARWHIQRFYIVTHIYTRGDYSPPFFAAISYKERAIVTLSRVPCDFNRIDFLFSFTSLFHFSFLRSRFNPSFAATRHNKIHRQFVTRCFAKGRTSFSRSNGRLENRRCCFLLSCANTIFETVHFTLNHAS